MGLVKTELFTATMAWNMAVYWFNKLQTCHPRQQYYYEQFHWHNLLVHTMKTEESDDDNE